MKKLALLGFIISILLLLDGFLAHDIFDIDLLSPAGWLILVLAIIFFAIICIADSTAKYTPSKTSKSKNVPEKDDKPIS
ncbi:MAG: hypothetical protein ACQ9MH_03110 [Nitrospinales bacterium]